MTLHMNLIDGEWVKGEAVPNLNPANVKEVVGEYARATAEDAAARDRRGEGGVPGLVAVGAARAARRAAQGRRRDHARARRSSAGSCRARRARRSPRASARRCARRRSSTSSPASACGSTGETVPSVRPGVGVEITREAVGVVGLITPWNFPIAIPAWKIAPALAYGNTVVFKPADLVPGCTWAIVDILQRAGLPKGVLNLVMGKGSVVGQAILDSPDVSAISFTGSQGTGARVAEARDQGDAPLPARDGRQEPARGARRRRPRRRPSTARSTAPTSRPASAAPPRRG